MVPCDWLNKFYFNMAAVVVVVSKCGLRIEAVQAVALTFVVI